jgi:hypothetical protein
MTYNKNKFVKIMGGAPIRETVFFLHIPMEEISLKIF